MRLLDPTPAKVVPMRRRAKVMKPPRQLVGTGITQRERVTLLRIDRRQGGDAGVYENPEMAGQTSWGGMANFVEDIRRWAAEVLTEAGLPSSYGHFWLLPMAATGMLRA